MTYLCRTRPSMAGTSHRTFSDGEKRGSGVAWRRRGHGRGQRWRHSLWDNPRPSQLLQVYWESYLGGVRRLDSGGQKPLESTEEVGTNEKRAEQGGCGCPGLGKYLLRGVPVGHVVRVGDVGHYPTHWEDFGRIPPQGGPQADGEATSTRKGQCMGIPPSGGNSGGCKTEGGGDLRLSPM